MSERSIASRHCNIDSCTFQLQSWKPFNLTVPNLEPNLKSTTAATHRDSDSHSSRPTTSSTTTGSFTIRAKRPCLSDRATSLALSFDSIDFYKLTLFDDGGPDKRSSHLSPPPSYYYKKRDKFPWMARKQRRRWSRSVSGRSSTDQSVTLNCRCYSAGATATATCSDFVVAAGGTDSSGELFVNVNAYGGGWASDTSEARSLRRERGEGGGGGNGDAGERNVLYLGVGYDPQAQWSESGYGSETGYRGDGELGYGNEDEEQDRSRLLFWGRERLTDGNMEMEIVGENAFLEQKNHHRGRRKKQDWNGR